MTNDLEEAIQQAIDARFNPPRYWCLRKRCSNILPTSIEGGLCSHCQERWTHTEVRFANIASKMNFSPGVFFPDLDEMLGRSLDELEALDADQLARLWDTVGLPPHNRPLCPAEKKRAAESNERALDAARRRAQEAHLARAERTLIEAQKALEAAKNESKSIEPKPKSIEPIKPKTVATKSNWRNAYMKVI